ncbi:MAG: alkaline phosphatase family protein [Lentisphaeria bacterium]|nr:alkaline phosphatase family protein [Lentisphaeria bacterium]
MNQVSRDELQSFMKQYDVDYSIGDLTPTVCALHGVAEPAECGGTPIAEVVDQAQHLADGEGKIERTLIYCPDAAGDIQRQKFPELFARVEKLAGMRFLSSGVMPSVTPVCYATIFSGASPQVHGTLRYDKRRIEIPTLFDAFVDAGKSVAVVAVNNCSIDTIFRKRKIDYYSTRTDAIAHRITRRLIALDEYDVIVSYFNSYDHLSHHFGGESIVAAAALTTAVEYFENLVADVDKYWKKHPRAVIWTPDHGNHAINDSQSAHGKNIPEDMLVDHYYRLRAAEE